MHQQLISSPPGLVHWACLQKASALGSGVGWTLARSKGMEGENESWSFTRWCHFVWDNWWKWSQRTCSEQHGIEVCRKLRTIGAVIVECNGIAWFHRRTNGMFTFLLGVMNLINIELTGVFRTKRHCRVVCQKSCKLIQALLPTAELKYLSDCVISEQLACVDNTEE